MMMSARESGEPTAMTASTEGSEDLRYSHHPRTSTAPRPHVSTRSHQPSL